MITDNYGVIYSDDMTQLHNASACEALIYTVPEGVISIDDKAFFKNDKVQMIRLPSTCCGLGSEVFASMKNLVYVDMGKTMLNRISEGIFAGSSKLECVYFPKTVQFLESRAFLHTGIQKIDFIKDFGESPLIIDENAFWYSDIHEVRTNVVQDEMFNGCKKLQKVTITDGTRYIGSFAFKGCDSLTTVDIPDSITRIGISSFADCPIKEIILPKELENLYGSSFLWSKAERIISNSPYFIVEDNTLYDSSKNEIWGCWGDSATHLASTECYFMDSAFLGNCKIREILLDNVPMIGERCFKDMKNLENVKLNSYTIGAYAFSGCKKLSTVEIEGCDWFNDHTFENCDELCDISHYEVSHIGKYCFNGCKKLKNLKFYRVSYVGEYAFNHCDSITSIQLQDPSVKCSRMIILKRHSFAGMSGLQEMELPEGVEELNHNFDDCVSLEKVKLPKTIQKICYGSLGRNCPSLKEILIPKGESARFQGLFKKTYHSLLKEY